MAEVSQYHKVSSEAEESSLSRAHRKAATCSEIYSFVPWALLVVLTVAYGIQWHSKHQQIQSTCFDGGVLMAPVIWEERTYMSNLDGNVKDIYSMDNPDVEAAWKAVRYEHVTAITAEEAKRLPGHRQTAELYGPQEGYAVLLEVFHQIHCLDAIRRAYYGNRTQSRRGFEDSLQHNDHCFSYLLQMIMCHADVGVMTTRWVERQQDFAAYFNVTRQCHNFEAVRSWAEERRALYETPAQISSHYG